MAEIDQSAAAYTGLTSAEAGKILQRDGFNELLSARPKSALRIIIDVLKEPMLLLLLGCGILYLVIGDPAEALMLMLSMLIIIGISFFQGRKTERALDKLKDLSAPRALVMRDGVEVRIPGREVVTDDIIVLQEGDRVPADALVLAAVNLQTDESLLTGESAPVAKRVRQAEEQEMTHGVPLYKVCSGSMVVRGHGIARVSATGQKTELGKIGKLLQQVKDEPTLLQQETRKLIRTFFVIGMSFCVVMVVVYGLMRENWIDGVLYGLSLAMALMPEEFAIVLTLFMVFGSLRLARRNVLTRKAEAIESLASMTVLCTDKTGTLTENQMIVTRLWQNGNYSEPAAQPKDEPIRALIRTAALASQPQPFDPMEKAIVRLLSNTDEQDRSAQNMELIREYPLAPQLLAMTRIYKPGAEYIIASKGSPEAIAKLCRLEGKELSDYNDALRTLAGSGLRVLGVATAAWNDKALPETQGDFHFQLSGLLAFEDPLRATIKEDLAQCYSAGIRVIMITGDNPVTAQFIAQKMGLKNSEEVITGDQLAQMDEPELAMRIRTTNVFARVVPDQKLRLVEALRNNGEVIGMTGDGVNDAPALRSANIGIAMGQRGTDVAREAADLVLLDDNFTSVIAAVRTGRSIHDNIRRAMVYVFAVHIPIVGFTLLPVLLSWLPVILFPLHIAFMELIIDPASSLVFEAEEEDKNSMQRPPAQNGERIFSTQRIILAIVMGLLVLVTSTAVLFGALQFGKSEDESRALLFTTLVFSNLGLVVMARSYSRSNIFSFHRKNKPMIWISASILIILGLILAFPESRHLFHFGKLHWDDIAFCFLAALTGMGIFYGVRAIFKRRNHVGKAS